MAPDLIAELALIEMSRLQRHALVLATCPDKAANKLAEAYTKEMARRDLASKP